LIIDEVLQRYLTIAPLPTMRIVCDSGL